jgi:hypothetical protein
MLGFWNWLRGGEGVGYPPQPPSETFHNPSRRDDRRGGVEQRGVDPLWATTRVEEEEEDDDDDDDDDDGRYGDEDGRYKDEDEDGDGEDADEARLYDPALLAGARIEEAHTGMPLPLLRNAWQIFTRTPISSGSFGTAYLVRNVRTGRRCVMKIFRSVGSQSLMREVEALEGVSRDPDCLPHVACYLGAFVVPFEGSYRFAILSEYVPGRTMIQWARDVGEISPEGALQVLADMLRGLASIHAHGYAHRDIKPDNVIVDDEDGGLRATIIDLGVACSLPLAGDPSFRCRAGYVSNALYAAPDLLAGDFGSRSDVGEIYQRGDVYATAACMYWFLTRIVPSPEGGRGVRALLLPQFNGCTNFLLERMLSARPYDRPTAAEALRELRDCNPDSFA